MRDSGGLDSTAVVKGGEVRSSVQYPGHPQYESHNAYFETGAGESLFDGVFGTTVDIRASDQHDNSRTTVGLERSNFYGQMAKELGPMASRDTAADLGLLSGFTAGMGGTARAVKAVVNDPLGFVDALSQVAQLIHHLGLLPKLLAAMPGQMVEDLKDKQDRNNPYDPDTEADRYGAFEAGYYLGYGAYYLASIIVGERVKTVVKNSKRFQRMVDRLDSKGHITQANRYLDAAKGRTSDPVKKTGYKLGARAAKGSWYFSKESGRRVLSGVKTAGQQYRVAQKLSDANGATLSKLNGFRERVQRKFGPGVARGESPKALTDGGKNYVDRLDDLDDVDIKTARRLDKIERDGENVDPLVWAYQDGEIDGGDLRRAAKLLDSDSTEYYADDDITAKQLLEVEADGGDLSKTEFVTSPDESFNGNTDVVSLELGDRDTGWIHIRGRHVYGTIELDEKKITSFFPIGQQIKGRTLPSKLDEREVKELVYKAVKKGEDPKVGKTGDIEYTYEPSIDGVEEMTVRVDPDSGKVIAAFPEGESSAVKQWLSGVSEWKDRI